MITGRRFGHEGIESMTRLDFELKLDPADPFIDALVMTRWPASRSPMMPSAKSWIDDEEHRTEQQRLDVTVAVAVHDPVDQERHPCRDGGYGGDQAEQRKDLERLVAGVDPEDRQCRCGAHRAEVEPNSAGLAGLSLVEIVTSPTAIVPLPARIRLSSV